MARSRDMAYYVSREAHKEGDGASVGHIVIGKPRNVGSAMQAMMFA